MSGHHIKSLENLSFRHVCNEIVMTCLKLKEQVSSEEKINFARNTFRRYYINKLPNYLHSQIFKKTMTMLRHSAYHKKELIDHAEVYLLNILLDYNIKEIKFYLCRCVYDCNHLQSVLKLLASEGVGLESLELLDCCPFLPFWHEDLLHPALANMKNLSHLMLRYTASDYMLKIIGKNCAKLVILDIAHSPVTDTGLMYLFLEQELQDICPLCRKYLSWSQFKTLLVAQDKKRKSGKKEAQKNKNSLCDTLKVLDIGHTDVTIDGGILAFLCIPQLVSLGEWRNIVKVINVMDEIIESKLPYDIIQAADIKTTENRLDVLAQRCPKVEILYLLEPSYCLKAVNAFSYITSLTICGASDEWVTHFDNYLPKIGQNLRELHFRHDNNTYMKAKLREILDNCPNLRTLSVFAVIWTEGRDPPPHRYLKKMHFGVLDNTEMIVKILSLAPELEVMHVSYCRNLMSTHLDEYLNKMTDFSRLTNQKLDMCYDSLKNLKCFHVSETKHLSRHRSKRIIENLLNACKQLQRFGNLWTWSFDKSFDRRLYLITLHRRHPDVNFNPKCHIEWRKHLEETTDSVCYNNEMKFVLNN